MFTISGDTRPSTVTRAPSHRSILHPSSSEAGEPAAQERREWLAVLHADPAWSRKFAQSREWLALGEERDPAFFDAALLQFARRLESEGRGDIAAALYGAVAEFAHASEYAPRARSCLEVLRGGSAFGDRAEILLRRFGEETLDPAVLAGFFAGGLAYRLGRAWGLGRLVASPASSLLSHAFLRRSAAATIGFSFEVPAFVLAARGASALLGRPGALDGSGLGRELASAAAVLGPMKLVAAGGTALAGRAFGSSHAMRSAFVGASALGGIFLGHRFEQALGLKPGQAAALTLLDSLVLLLQARVGGGLLEATILGRLRPWELGLERRLSLPRSPTPPVPGPRPLEFAEARAYAGPGVPSPSAAKVDPAPAKGFGVSLMGSTRDGGFSPRLVAFERGALAWGGSGALQWLLELRRHYESKTGPGNSEALELWWIPESPVDTVLLNDFGMRYRREQGLLERVNIASRPAVRAFWPVLRKGEAFVHTRDLSSDIGRVLNKWTEREDPGLRALLNAQWLDLQFDNLCRSKPGFVERVREGGKEFLIFENGKRQLLPPNLSLYASPTDPRSLQARASVSHFQNQYWERTPAEAALIFGERLGEDLPRGTVITQYLDPRALMLPNWAGPRGLGAGTRFFFIQGLRSWVAEVSGSQLRDVTAEESPARLALLREWTNPKPEARPAESEATPAPERSASARVEPAGEAPGEAPGTKRYPTENYPEAVFGASTVPYPELYPKPIEPEVSLPMTTRHRAATPLPVETGPTDKLPEADAAPTAPFAEPRRAETPRVFPLPAPEPSAKAARSSVPVFEKDPIGKDPTLELTPELSQQMLGKKPLPFDDTVEMSPVQIAEARRGAIGKGWMWGPRRFLSDLKRDLAQVWRQRAWVWAELRVRVYGFLGRTPPPALLEQVRTYRESFRK